MKPHLLFLACLSLLGFTPLGLAAETKSTGELVSASPPPPKPVPPLNISVDFPGGSISKLLEAMSKIDGVSFNIIGADGAREFNQLDLPPFSLKNVSLINVLE